MSWIKDLKHFGLGEVHAVTKGISWLRNVYKIFFLYGFEGDLVVTAFPCNNGSPLCDTDGAAVL